MRAAARAGRAQFGAARSCSPPPAADADGKLAICASSSERTGTAISAAAVGVGARRSEAKSISVTSVSCPTAEMSGIMLLGRRAHHDFLVERPQILERAAAPRDDEEIRPRHGALPAAH